ncbi:DNA cytosine methyltransferase [Kocuria sp. MNB10]
MTTTMTDLFCGAGGSSTGGIQVPGVTVRVASNHWPLAVETHNTNHPYADHICADLSQINPSYFPATDLLWASPECTNHSIAKGRRRATDTPDLFGQGLPDEAAQRSRATMWDVPRFAEVHRYEAVIVENVVDAARWTPFRAWLMAMDSLGYQHHIVYLNSMHAWAAGEAAPQSRDRMYVVFWRKGNRKPELEAMQRPPAHCPTHGQVRAMQAFKNPAKRWGRYRAQYVYRCPRVECRNTIVEPAWVPAASIIDWSDVGTRIGDRPRPLAAKTLARIQAGIDRYWTPTLVPVEGRDGKAAQPVTGPVRTQTTRNETGVALPPMMHLEAAGNTYDAADPKHPAHDRRDGYYRVWDGAEPLRTMHTTASKGVAFPPFIAELRGGGSDARAVRDPLATVTASGNHHALIMRNNGPGGTDGAHLSTPVTEPVRTVTTAGHQSLVRRGDSIRVDDCSFRMLTPHEIQRAMAFPADYTLLGTKREQVRMAGNAVTPPTARDLIGAVTASLN